MSRCTGLCPRQRVLSDGVCVFGVPTGASARWLGGASSAELDIKFSQVKPMAPKNRHRRLNTDSDGNRWPRPWPSPSAEAGAAGLLALGAFGQRRVK